VAGARRKGGDAGGGAAAAEPVLAFSMLEVHASWKSLLERAPAIDALRLAQPRLRLTRDVDGIVRPGVRTTWTTSRSRFRSWIFH